MPRRPRICPGGLVYHVLNRAVARLPLFEKDGDYEAFRTVLALAQEEHPTRLLAYCLMPNHWHLVLWPRREGELTAFVRWLTHTHAMRWHAHSHTAGTGHLYQGRFKSFPVAADDHLYAVLRYVERNPLRAGLVAQAQRWPWSSLALRKHAPAEGPALLSPWPVPLPKGWVAHVNGVEAEAELAAVRRAVARGSPFGSLPWQRRTARRLGLEYTLRPRGRPKKAAKEQPA
jgi:putative transposase